MIRLRIPERPDWNDFYPTGVYYEAAQFIMGYVDVGLGKSAKDAFDEGDAAGILRLMDSRKRLGFVVDAWWYLRKWAMLEETLAHALVMSKPDHHKYCAEDIHRLFESVSHHKLREAGDQMPRGKSFGVYRGVSGERGRRKVRGLLWTGSLEAACWHALRYDQPNPAVYRARVARKHMYYYSNGRNEHEYICWPSSYRRMRLREEEMYELSKSYKESKKKESKKSH